MLKQALVAPPAPEKSGPIRVPAVTVLTLLLAAGLLVVLGVLPSLVLGWF